MPRQVRIEYEGAIYHVMARGDHREMIVRDNEDRTCFEKSLEEVVGKMGWHLYAYVLMGNHYHLVFRTPEANLVRGMTWLQSTVTKRYNARHKQRGHLFSGRYKAVLVEENDYLTTLYQKVCRVGIDTLCAFKSSESQVSACFCRCRKLSVE